MHSGLPDPKAKPSTWRPKIPGAAPQGRQALALQASPREAQPARGNLGSPGAPGKSVLAHAKDGNRAGWKSEFPSHIPGEKPRWRSWGLHISNKGYGPREQRDRRKTRQPHQRRLRGFYEFTQASRISTVPSSPYATGLVSEPSRIWLCALRRGCTATELGPVAPPRRPAPIGGRQKPSRWLGGEGAIRGGSGGFGCPRVISSASDTPQRQQWVGALWRWRRVSGCGCSSDSSELFQAGSDSFLPLPSPFFVFRSPSPSLPRPRRPDPEEAAAGAAAEFSVKVSGATAGAAAEWSALKWPPSLAASSWAAQNGGHRRSRAGRLFFSVSSGFLAPENSSSLFSLPVADGVGGSRQPWRSTAVFGAVGGRPPRGPGRAKARVCSDVERAWPGGARGGDGRGPAGAGGPAVGAGPAEPEESRSPASRRGGSVWSRGRRGAVGLPLVGERRACPASPACDGRRGGNEGFWAFVDWAGSGEAAVSPSGIYGWEGAAGGGGGWEGGRLSAREQRAGRLAAGAASAPPRGLPPAASVGGCRNHFPNSGLGGRNPLLFCSQEGGNGAEVPAAMLWPWSSACLMSAAVQLRSPPQALCAQLRGGQWEKPSYSVLLVVEAVKSITMFSHGVPVC